MCLHPEEIPPIPDEMVRERCANSSYARSLLASPLLPKGEANAKGEGSLVLC